MCINRCTSVIYPFFIHICCNLINISIYQSFQNKNSYKKNVHYFFLPGFITFLTFWQNCLRISVLDNIYCSSTRNYMLLSYRFRNCIIQECVISYSRFFKPFFVEMVSFTRSWLIISTHFFFISNKEVNTNLYFQNFELLRIDRNILKWTFAIIHVTMLVSRGKLLLKRCFVDRTQRFVVLREIPYFTSHVLGTEPFCTSCFGDGRVFVIGFG